MRRWLFVLTLAFASSFWAESVEGNFNPVAFTIWGWISIIPLYGLHALILGRVAFAKAKPSFTTLYLCGVLFGLYEAYITKVVWTGWPPDPIKIGGVSLMALLAVVLWWHPFMAFLVPLAFVERYAVGGDHGRTVLTPKVARALEGTRGPWLMAVFGAFTGLYQIGVGGQKPYAWAAGIVDALVLTLLIYWLRKKRPSNLQSMLPTGKGLKVAVIALAFLYLLCGFGLNPQSMPGLMPQVLVWGLYALVIAALLVSKRRDADLRSCRFDLERWEDESIATVEADTPSEERTLEPVRLRREWLPFVVSWACVSFFQFPLPALRLPAIAFVTLIGICVGVRAIVLSYHRVCHPVLYAG